MGGAAGVPVGTLLLPHVNQTPFKAAVGLLLVVWCPTMLFARSLPLVRAGGRVADGGAGMLGGIMGGLGGLSGPAPILWCTLRGWGRDTQRSVFQAFNLAIHSFTMSAYLATGMVTAETAKLFAIVVPAMLVPNLIGARLYARFSDQTFRRLVLVLLLLSGIGLLTSATVDLVRGKII
jgi:uncharacterized membrane protein YfcA